MQLLRLLRIEALEHARFYIDQTFVYESEENGAVTRIRILLMAASTADTTIWLPLFEIFSNLTNSLTIASLFFLLCKNKRLTQEAVGILIRNETKE